MHKIKILISLLSFLLFTEVINAQENAWEDLLKKEVEVLNPTYKPVIGAGICFFDFRGNIRNTGSFPLAGNIGYKVNVHTYLDSKRYFKANIFGYVNQITVNQRSFDVPDQNLNFQSSMIIFGVNVLYDFKHFIKKDQFITPFVSLGVESVYFNSKTDLSSSQGTYYYWPDGTIRNAAFPNVDAKIIQRDYIYETDLRQYNLNHGTKNYSQNTFAIPAEAGLDFYISARCYLRLSLTYHYTFTPYIDYIANSPDAVKAKNDRFLSTNLTVHLDLFSDPKTRIQNLLFADVDFDYTMYGDEDNDLVFDGWDKCPGTPAGVPVDSSGCPFDSDKDGVPDYKDKQPNTRMNAIVDNNGVEITDDTLLYFFTNYEPVKRSDVDLYLKLYSDQTPKMLRKKLSDMPPKFKAADINNDGYVSYEEILQTIDNFYDFETDFTYMEIEELIEFFFSQ